MNQPIKGHEHWSILQPFIN